MCVRARVCVCGLHGYKDVRIGSPNYPVMLQALKEILKSKTNQ